MGAATTLLPQSNTPLGQQRRPAHTWSIPQRYRLLCCLFHPQRQLRPAGRCRALAPPTGRSCRGTRQETSEHTLVVRKRTPGLPTIVQAIGGRNEQLRAVRMPAGWGRFPFPMLSGVWPMSKRTNLCNSPAPSRGIRPNAYNSYGSLGPRGQLYSTATGSLNTAGNMRGRLLLLDLVLDSKSRPVLGRGTC